ncbi:hypothetical protein LTR95_008659 [Oleoguttula sp. CCFEE 5521]
MDRLANLTIQIPPGTTLSNDGRVLCTSGNAWKEALLVFTFFATNYLAHAATIKSTPGDTTTITACNMCLAILFPMSGLMRALNAIARFARFGESEIENACRAGALCMVVRSPEWMPEDNETFDATVSSHPAAAAARGTGDDNGQSVRGSNAKLVLYLPRHAREDTSSWLYFDTVGSRAFVDTNFSRIHGTFFLPYGYSFAILPRDTLLTTIPTPSAPEVVPGDISSNFSTAKAVLSLVQALAAAVTLTSHKGDLIDRWGYTSYHLTVVPYLVMTIVNFVSNALTPNYPCIYMVRTQTMDEAQKRGGKFVGTVGTVRGNGATESPSEEEPSRWEGIGKEHLELIIKSIAGLDPLKAFGLFNKRDRQPDARVSMSITCSGSRTSSESEGNHQFMELVAECGKPKYRRIADASNENATESIYGVF